VRQVGHLPELYEDARSEKYKMLCYVVMVHSDLILCVKNLKTSILDFCVVSVA